MTGASLTWMLAQRSGDRRVSTMTSYTVEIPEGRERGIRIECDEHGGWEAFQPGYRTVPCLPERTQYP